MIKIIRCRQIGCNKKATHYIDKKIVFINGIAQQGGYCTGHYLRVLSNTR